MLRKFSWLFLMILMVSCSGFPYRIVRVSDMVEPVQVEPLAAATCPDPCPACPQPVCPQPVCPQPVCPTWPGSPPTVEVSTVTPLTPVTPSRTATQPTSTWTPSPTLTATFTKTATLTLTPSKTNTPTTTITPTMTLTSTLTRTPTQVILPYTIQPSTPAYLQSFAHPEAGCNWLGVAGQVFDRAGKPITNMVVVVEGVLNNSAVDLIGLTGLNGAYGPGGFEIQLANRVMNSTNTLTITLYDLAGSAMTYPFAFSTYADCSKNLILINFNQR